MDMYKPDPAHLFFSPLILSDNQLRGFPKSCFHIAGFDILRDEGLLFEEKLRRAGQVIHDIYQVILKSLLTFYSVKTWLHVYSGFPHGFMGFPQLKESEKWRENIYQSIKWLLKDEKD
jgi:acetyl esterase/lipase